MFQKLRLWLAGSDASGLREAAREGAREAVREGTIEGAKLGLQEAIEELTGISARPAEPVKTIESKAARPAVNGRRKAAAK